MSKIILEDLKFKKTRKRIIESKKVESKEEEIKPKLYKKETLINKRDNVYNPPKNEEIAVEDERINEYLSKIHKRDRVYNFPDVREEKRGLRRSLTFLFILVFFVGAFYWVSDYFYNATIHITKRNEILNLENKKFILSSSDENNIDFEIMIVEAKEKKELKLSEKENVSIKAKGEVVFYNEFATTPQKLLVGTFLVDETGKTYKTDSVVTIPGYKMVDGKKVPGDISAPITSFLAGESYNGSPNNFYISGFKNTDKYSKIYAKLKSPLVGGISGEVYKISNIDKDNINIFANSSLNNILEKKLKAEIPKGYIYYEGASTLSYDNNSEEYFKTENADVTISGKLTAILIKEDTLKESIIKLFSNEIKDKEMKMIDVTNLKDLEFNFNNKEQAVDKEIDNVEFLISGEAKLLWNPDILFLKSKLAGVSKSEAIPIFSLDPGVSHASLSIFPPWKKFLPEDLSKINIIID